jgi:hypothetical protein
MESAKTKPGSQMLRSKSTGLSTGKKVTIGPQSNAAFVESPTAAGHPSIQLMHGDQGIDSIEVVCACGERIIIRCEYVE